MTKTATDVPINFIYAGINQRGESIKGEISSRNMALAKAQLRRQGIVIRQIRKKPTPLFQFKQSIRPLDIAIFVRQLATMLKAGMPLIQSFEIVADILDNPSMTKLVISLKNEVETGTTFSVALRKHPRYFDDLFCSLIEAGEQSGSLDVMLDRIATYKEKSERLKSKIKKAVKYPIAVLIVAFVVTWLLLLFVVPKMAGLFSSFDAELPAFTRFVLTLSNWMGDWWWLLLIVMFAAVSTFVIARHRSTAFQHHLDRIVLKLPIFGKITYHAVMARFSRTLSITFAAGVPLIDALDSTAGATNNIVFYNATQQIKDNVATGQQMNFAIRHTQKFPSLVVQMVGIGEESGSLDEMLDKVATYYEDDVDNAIDGLTSLLEPIIMVVLGILVGGLVIAMYMPLFQIGSVIS